MPVYQESTQKIISNFILLKGHKILNFKPHAAKILNSMSMGHAPKTVKRIPASSISHIPCWKHLIMLNEG